jgi:serine/threonine protein kinase
MITSEYQALLCIIYCMLCYPWLVLPCHSLFCFCFVPWIHPVLNSLCIWYAQHFRLVYRDIKQENIGFDCRGDVKVFDMGLCKSLNPAQRSKDGYGRVAYGYLLTPRTGSGKCNFRSQEEQHLELCTYIRHPLLCDSNISFPALTQCRTWHPRLSCVRYVVTTCDDRVPPKQSI